MKRISKQVILYHCTNVFGKVQENTWKKKERQDFQKQYVQGMYIKKYVMQIKPQNKSLDRKPNDNNFHRKTSTTN